MHISHPAIHFRPLSVSERNLAAQPAAQPHPFSHGRIQSPTSLRGDRFRLLHPLLYHLPAVGPGLPAEGKLIDPFLKMHDMKLFPILLREQGSCQIFRTEIGAPPQKAEPEHGPHIFRLHRHRGRKAAAPEKLTRQSAGNIIFTVQKKRAVFEEKGQSLLPFLFRKKRTPPLFPRAFP